MPKKCGDCKFSQLYGWDEEYMCIVKKGLYVHWLKPNRPTDCPLIEVAETKTNADRIRAMGMMSWLTG